ncbi:hypothetical protein F5X96DRAFT_298119 [Biscogniauxia mediterranea]|nr:hypothetical protein F5X96DRAFT_298119 [Biscogniauxia mediterranea]
MALNTGLSALDPRALELRDMSWTHRFMQPCIDWGQAIPRPCRRLPLGQPSGMEDGNGSGHPSGSIRKFTMFLDHVRLRRRHVACSSQVLMGHLETRSPFPWILDF